MLRVLCLSLALLPSVAAAQEAQAPSIPQGAILTIVPDRLFAETRAGNTAAQRFDEATRALMAENRRLEIQLEDEERALTARRGMVPAEEFRRLADEFDTRADRVRSEQDAKSRNLTRMRDVDIDAFFQAARPVLGEMMRESGALAILNRSSVFLSSDVIDVTDAAIVALDEALGDGAAIFQQSAP